MLGSIWLFATLWGTQSPVSMGFSSHKYWSGWPFPPAGDLLKQRWNTPSPASPELAGGFFTAEPPDKLQAIEYTHNFERFFGEGRRKDLLLTGSKENTRNISQSCVSSFQQILPACPIGVALICIFTSNATTHRVWDKVQWRFTYHL